MACWLTMKLMCVYTYETWNYYFPQVMSGWNWKYTYYCLYIWNLELLPSSSNVRMKLNESKCVVCLYIWNEELLFSSSNKWLKMKVLYFYTNETKNYYFPQVMIGWNWKYMYCVTIHMKQGLTSFLK